MHRLFWFMLIYLFICSSVQAGSNQVFEYDQRSSLDVKENSVEEKNGVKVLDISYSSPGGRVTAYLVEPQGKGPFAAVLFMHWGQGNRSEFLDEAIELASAGVVSLLLDAPFARPEPWRRPAKPGDYKEDREIFVQSIIDMRRGVDLLETRSNVDRKRIGYVGHSYGASLAGALAATEKRIKALVLMAGLPSISEFTRSSKHPGMTKYRESIPKEDFERYVKDISVIDANQYIGKATPSVLFFQFAEQDEFITKEDAVKYFQLASEPKEVKWYEGGHELNKAARRDRIEFLKKHLN
jgi:dienelactone hydrolase